MRILPRALLPIACAALTAACSSSPPREYIEIPAFNSVALVQMGELPNVEKQLTPQEHVRDKAGQGANIGMASGLASGVILCGLSGPFAGLCISGLGLAGWAAGGIGGVAYGIAVAEEEGEGATQINDQVQRVVSRGGLNADFVDALSRQVSLDVRRPVDEADIAASPVFTGVEVSRPEEGVIKLKFTADLLFSWGDSAGESYFGRAQFKHRSAPAPIEDWMADGGALFDAAFAEAMTALSQKMAERINQRLAQGAQTLEVQRDGSGD
jgi:hypothetical protein